MATDTSICNQALDALGKPRLTSLGVDGSFEDNLCVTAYPEVRDEVLRLHPWNVGVKRTILNSEPFEQTNPKMQAVKGLIWASELSLWVAVGDTDATRPYIITSPDKITWTQRTAGLSKAFNLGGIAFDGTTLVAVGGADGSDAYIVTSTDGITWTERANPKNFGLLEIVWAGGIDLFIAVGSADGSDAYLVTSPDGTTWTERANPKNFALADIAWTGSVAVAVGVADGTDAYIVTSSDGTTWTERANAQNLQLSGITWSGSRLVAVGVSTGTEPYTITSDDGGATWTQRSNVPKALNLNSITFGNGFYVAVGVADTVDNDDTFVVASIDGESWGERYLGKNIALNAIEFGGTNFMMGGEPDGKDAYLLSWAGPPAYGLSFSFALPSDFMGMVDVNEGDLAYKLENGQLLYGSTTAPIRYQFQQTDPNELDSLLQTIIALRLAVRLSIPLTGSVERLAIIDDRLTKAEGAAVSRDAKEDGEDPPVEDPWIEARFGGAGTSVGRWPVGGFR